MISLIGSELLEIINIIRDIHFEIVISFFLLSLLKIFCIIIASHIIFFVIADDLRMKNEQTLFDIDTSKLSSRLSHVADVVNTNYDS